jgi:sugar phosphate isomerase/epimerase
MSEVKLPRPAVVAAALSEDFRAAVKLARAAGFAAVQMGPRLGGLDLLTLSQSDKRELRAILRVEALEMVGLRLDLGGKGLGPGADIDAALDGIEKVLVAAAGLQCPLVCVDLGAVPTETTAAATLDAALFELGRRADRHGVVVAFRSELAAFAAIDRAMKSVACPWFGIDLDPVAMLIDEWSEDEIFSRIGGLIRHVRGRDAVAGADRRIKPAAMGTGSVDWRRLVAGLEGAGFRGWITIDPMDLSNRSAAAVAGLAQLRSVIGSI